MAEKKFAGLNGSLESPELSADYDSAAVFERLRVGEKGVYFRDGLRTRCLLYSEIDRAFIRVQETRSRMCCGQACAAARRTSTISAWSLCTAGRRLPTT